MQPITSMRSRKFFKIKQSNANETHHGDHGWKFTIFIFDRWIDVEFPSSSIAFVDYNDQVIHVYEDSIGAAIYDATKDLPR